MRKTVSLFFLHVILKGRVLIIMIRWRNSCLALKGKLLSISKRCCPFAKRSYLIIIVRSVGDIVSRTESVGLGKRIELLRPRTVEGWFASLNVIVHPAAIKLMHYNINPKQVSFNCSFKQTDKFTKIIIQRTNQLKKRLAAFLIKSLSCWFSWEDSLLGSKSSDFLMFFDCCSRDWRKL